jgi:pyridoxamine 5'-phosphate oxidase
MDNFSKSDVDPDPIRQFHLWFDQAVKANELDPDATALSTASSEGRVSSRIVLLKGCSERGFVFYTNYESRKSGELGENPWAALTFYWRVLHRQVRIEGRVEKYRRRSRPSTLRLGRVAASSERGLHRRVRRYRIARNSRSGWRSSSGVSMTGRFRVRPTGVAFCCVQ